MRNSISIRKETKHDWERRTPLTPEAVQNLLEKGIKVFVQSSNVRIYDDIEYQKAGAEICEKINDFKVIIGIKEPPKYNISENQIHVTFSHTSRGQTHNLEMLKDLINKKITLIDYEHITDKSGVKFSTIFSEYAGIVGMVEALIAWGKKEELRGNSNILSSLKQPWQHGRLFSLRKNLKDMHSLREPLKIIIVGGGGHIAKGAQSVLENLGISKIDANEIENTNLNNWYSILDIKNIVKSKDGGEFNLEEYFLHGKEKYESTFSQYLGKFNILVQGGYWDNRYPKQLSLDVIKEKAKDLPDIIADLTCYINGPLDSTLKMGDMEHPCYTLDPETMTTESTITLKGPSIIAIDNLPGELPLDASDRFSTLLEEAVPIIAEIDLNKPFEECGLTQELQNATILYKGEFTKPFKYMKKFI